MYTAINGWTKKKMLAVIKKRRYNAPAIKNGACVYLSSNGNKCAVGLFIPDGHHGQRVEGPSDVLFSLYPELKKVMPLDVVGMDSLQSIHDNTFEQYSGEAVGNAKQAMLDWVNEYVKDGK